METLKFFLSFHVHMKYIRALNPVTFWVMKAMSACCLRTLNIDKMMTRARNETSSLTRLSVWTFI